MLTNLQVGGHVMSREERAFSIDLYWLPLGAGGRWVRLNGRLFEAVTARREHRAVQDLYHSALEVRAGEHRFVIEMAPVWHTDAAGREAVCEGPVGTRWLGRSRLFRYEVRRWRDGRIPDVASGPGPRCSTDFNRKSEQAEVRAMSRTHKTLIGISIFNAVSAIGGGISLVTGTLPVPKDLLRHTPFDSYVIPGLFLGVVIGGSALAGAVALLMHAKGSRIISEAAGVIMVGWIIGEVILIQGFSWLQGLYLLTGLLVAVGSRYLPPAHAPGTARLPAA